MIEFTFFDNLIEFLDDLYELLKEDWIKFKLFMNENKKSLIWLFIALITLQITDLITFGNSCNKYYKTQNSQIQKGGGGEGEPDPRKMAQSAEPTKQSAEPTKQSASTGATDKAARIESEKQKIQEKQKTKKADSELQKSEKNLELFNKLKGKKDKLAKNSIAGPIFGNLEGIFGAVGGIFSVVLTLLTILGVLSLPVLIFIIITYCIIKKVLSHLALI
jgi:hypothetical protein